MKNLILYHHFRTEFTDLRNVKHFCVSSHFEEIFAYSNNKICKLSTRNGQVDILYDIREYYNTNVPNIVHISFNSISDCLCLAFENGDVLTLETNSNDIQCVGCVESGIEAVQWSPDQEVIVFVTGQGTVIVMAGTFDPIAETDLYQNEFGEKQFITVGWGKKETQFHGSEGKAAALAVSKNEEKASHFDDGRPQISWRGDGSLFAVSIMRHDLNCRQIRILSREGVLQYTSELIVGLEGALSWRPSGNLIAASQRLPNKHVIAFLEKNGLRHGDFSLPFSVTECKIKQLSWNSESSILTVWGEYNDGRMCLQLWTVNNYHWYLKQNLNFPLGKRLLGIEWDVLHGNQLHVLCEGLTYICYKWSWTVNHSFGTNDKDEAFVAVVDGAKLLLTSFRKGIIPPPLCTHTLQLELPVNHVMFAPPVDRNLMLSTNVITLSDFNCNALCTVLCDGTLVVFTYSHSTKTYVQSFICKLDSENIADLHHWLWIKEDTVLCCRTQGVTSYVMSLHVDFNQGEVKIGKEISVGGIVGSFIMAPDSTRVLLQLENGSLYFYKPHESEIIPLLKPLPESCESLQVCQVEGKDVILGLSGRNRFYVDGDEVANNVTSIVVHSEFILLTTLKHALLCAQLNQKGLQSLIEGKCGPGRRVERGARLVTAVAGDTRVILQMPRGNLECIQPRPLTLHAAAVHLDAKRYGPAFQLFRKQRINLNLLCDHQPSVFLANINHVVEELKDPSWLSLFLSELQDENITHNMYKDYYTHLDQLPEPLTNKVQVVCDAIREAMLRKENADHYLLPILTSHVQKQTDKDLAEALQRVKYVKEIEKNNGHIAVSADEALKYLLYLVDVNRLYDIALGLYDFDLVMLVAAKSNKDPKEYLPFLNELRRMEPSYRCYAIDKYLRRFESALGHIAQCPQDDHFQECVNIVKSHKLYSQALKLFSKGSARYLEIATVYADYLMESRLYQEAGLMYTRAEKYHKALVAYQQAGDWRETLTTAKQLQYKENKLHELCQDVVSRLKIKRQFREAAEVLCQHIGDTEESISVLVQGKLWNEAVWSCSLNNRKDMIETHVKPGIMEHLDQLSSQLTSTQEQFNAYRTRLHVVRTAREKQSVEEKEDVSEECDLYSDTSSILASSISASHTGSRMTSRSSRSSKNRRKQERKMLSLKEGSPYEEYALIRALHQLITNAYDTTEEVHHLCHVLLKFDKDEEAAKLQKLQSLLLQTMDTSKQEIWIPDLLQQPQMGFGPDATVNSITSRMQMQSPVSPGLALLEPSLRYPPTAKNISGWQISILNK